MEIPTADQPSRNCPTSPTGTHTLSVFHPRRIKWPPDLNQSWADEVCRWCYLCLKCYINCQLLWVGGGGGCGVEGRGGCWLSHELRQARWATTVFECCAPSMPKKQLHSGMLPTAITRCINERFPLLDTASRRTTAQGHLTANFL